MIRPLLVAALLAAGAAAAQAPADLAKRAAYGDTAARNQLERLAESGDTLAQHYMGQLALAGRGVKKSEERAVEWFGRAAAKGDLASAHNLGVIYQRAGALKSREKALEWYRFAAERGFAPSQANLGEMLSAEKDPEGRQWIEKAAAQDNARGLYLLGMALLESGNDAAAAARMRRAAEAGEPDAQYRLALLLGAGRGVDKDEKLAMQWLRRAAEQRHAGAQYLLAAAYSRGLYGLARNDIEAADWLKRSARGGNADAQYALASAYAEGRGVPFDPNEALGWIQLAAKNGHPEAAAAHARIKALLAKGKPR